MSERFVVSREQIERFRDMLDDYREMKESMIGMREHDDARPTKSPSSCRSDEPKPNENENEKTEDVRADESLKILDALERIGLPGEESEKLRRRVCSYVVDGETCAFELRSSAKEDGHCDRSLGQTFDVYFTNIEGKRSGVVPKDGSR